jgi:hypothetical protein
MMNALYDRARVEKLKQLKRLMQELQLEDGDGSLSQQKLDDAMAEADGASADSLDGTDPGQPEADGIPEPDADDGEAQPPMDEKAKKLADLRKSFFGKKEAKPRRPGTALMIAVGDKMPGKSAQSKHMAKRPGHK